MIDFPAVSDREVFTSVLSNGSIRKGDAIVVLTGDGEQRLRVAVGLLQQGAAPLIVVTGGYTNPPHSLSATAMAGKLLAMGVAPGKVIVDNASMHTQHQATNVLALARKHGWHRLLIVASPYHAPRAFLTFLKVLKDLGREKEVQLVSVPAGMYIPWFTKPDGRDQTRAELLAEEYAKVEQYSKHVATYREGIEYLRHWESN